MKLETFSAQSFSHSVYSPLPVSNALVLHDYHIIIPDGSIHTFPTSDSLF